MKNIIFSVFILIFMSCTSRKENKTTTENNTPQVLQDNKETSLVSFKKRGPDDLVEELYKEKAKSTPALQTIEKLIDKLNEAEYDSLKDLNTFKSKNQQYFSSAKSHLSSIKDSLLRNEIDNILEKNILKYDNKISGLNNLVAVLNNQSALTDDRHTALMILISLGMINEYQEKSLPPSKPIESVINGYNTLNQKMDSVINKNK